MNQKFLTLIALFSSIIGLGILSFSIKSSPEQNLLELKGYVTSSKDLKNGKTLLTVKTNLPIIAPKNAAFENQRICVKGKLQEWKGRVEFFAKEITPCPYAKRLR